jgi:phosphotransferase system enzyme I (PtsI)
MKENHLENSQREIRLKGSPICSGVAIGTPFYFKLLEGKIPEFQIDPNAIHAEINRFRKAIACAVKDVADLQREVEQEGAFDAANILDSQLQLMDDSFVTSNVEDGIRSLEKNAEFVFYQVIKTLEERFSKISDAFFQERFGDVQDVFRRIMSHLQSDSKISLANVPSNSVVFASELSPSDTAEAKINDVTAFVTEKGGTTSHAAIVAKSKGIPFVANVNYSQVEKYSPRQVIVDGKSGEIILNPSLETIEIYRKIESEQRDYHKELEKSGTLSAETYDGYQVLLSANMEVVNDLDMLHEYGGSGVGLFRSEYMVLSNDRFPSEEEQYAIYKRLVEKMRGLPVVIRTFDIGGDKLMPSQKIPEETSGLLGCRAIRLMLKKRDVFKEQLRAVVRASVHGDVSIMFPMIASLMELREGTKVLREAEAEIRAEGIPLKKPIKVGCMIEVPSAAIICDLLAKECDFLSIGTNDLMQYSLAINRADEDQHEHFRPYHPSVVRLIKMVVSEGARQNIPVRICGEMASDATMIPLLLGLGVRELSVALRFIPLVKNTIRRTSILEAVELANKVLKCSTVYEVKELLDCCGS